jgi:general secretion pathway protein D
LLKDKYSGSQEKIPGLGDVPIFGNLFKSEARGRTKTNLMVFLRPVVVRDNMATGRLSMDRYDVMRAGMKEAQPEPSLLVPINEGPQLPILPGSQAPTTPKPLGASPDTFTPTPR